MSWKYLPKVKLTHQTSRLNNYLGMKKKSSQCCTGAVSAVLLVAISTASAQQKIDPTYAASRRANAAASILAAAASRLLYYTFPCEDARTRQRCVARYRRTMQPSRSRDGNHILCVVRSTLRCIIKTGRRHRLGLITRTLGMRLGTPTSP